MQTHTHEAEQRMHPVVVQEQTLAWRDRQFRPLRVRVRLDGIASAELHSRERTNRTFHNALFGGNLCGDFLLVQLFPTSIPAHLSTTAAIITLLLSVHGCRLGYLCCSTRLDGPFSSPLQQPGSGSLSGLTQYAPTLSAPSPSLSPFHHLWWAAPRTIPVHSRPYWFLLESITQTNRAANERESFPRLRARYGLIG